MDKIYRDCFGPNAIGTLAMTEGNTLTLILSPQGRGELIEIAQPRQQGKSFLTSLCQREGLVGRFAIGRIPLNLPLPKGETGKRALDDDVRARHASSAEAGKSLLTSLSPKGGTICKDCFGPPGADTRNDKEKIPLNLPFSRGETGKGAPV